MLNRLLRPRAGGTFYVRVEVDRFWLRDPVSGEERLFEATDPFTTERLLIGRFQVAEALLRQAIVAMLGNRLVAVPPQILIHPLVMTEGGLSEVEERVFREVALAAGAARVVVWVGPELEDGQVLERISAARA